MKLPKKLKLLINTYYAFQLRSHREKHNDVPDDWKLLCLKEIANECAKRNIDFAAAAGTFWLVRGKQKATVSKPFLP